MCAAYEGGCREEGNKDKGVRVFLIVSHRLYSPDRYLSASSFVVYLGNCYLILPPVITARRLIWKGLRPLWHSNGQGVPYLALHLVVVARPNLMLTVNAVKCYCLPLNLANSSKSGQMTN